MILIIDTDQNLVPYRSITTDVIQGIDGTDPSLPYRSITTDVIQGIDGTVFLKGTFREVGIGEVLQYQVEKAVADATDYHYETYHADDQT